MFEYLKEFKFRELGPLEGGNHHFDVKEVHETEKPPDGQSLAHEFNFKRKPVRIRSVLLEAGKIIRATGANRNHSEFEQHLEHNLGLNWDQRVSRGSRELLAAMR